MARRFFGLAVGLLLALSGMQAEAGGRLAARKQIESSLIVTGTIVIAPDGGVQSYALDATEALGAPLEAFLKQNISAWKFVPVEVDGKVVTAKANMSLQLIANQAEGGDMNVRIAHTWFGKNSDKPATDMPKSNKMSPPRYPQDVMRMGGQGIAYLVVNIGRDGKVLDVAAEKVNLRSLGTEKQMEMLRRAFADASVRAAREWTFHPPTTGADAARDSWIVRIPVAFVMGDATHGKAGTWQSYIPDPTPRVIPWAEEELRIAGSPEALPGSGVYPLQPGLRLLNQPGT